MYGYVKIQRKHGEVRFTVLELGATTPFGKDYGFMCTCITGSTKFPELSTTSERYRVTEILLIQ